MPSAIVLGFPAGAVKGQDTQHLLRAVMSSFVVDDLVEQEIASFTVGVVQGADGLELLRVATIDEKLDKALDQISGGVFGGRETVRVPAHPLGGRMSYEDLYRKCPATAKEFHFEFLSPTCFHHGDADVPLPLARPLFAGLYRRWKHSHTRIALHEEVVDAAEHHLVLATLRIETQPFKEERLTKTGFVGDVVFRVSGSVPRELLHELNALAGFAFFSSVGQKTQLGMGLARRIVH